MDMLIGMVSALWLGILTSISPCPLASNIAAISFLSKKVAHPLTVFLSGMAYTAGRMAAYAAIGFVLINSVLTTPQVAQFLQKYMSKALGPVLIVVGLILLEIIRINIPSLALSQKQHKKIAEAGLAGSFLLGAIFALAFCPVSAALFFGSLIPLALRSEAGVTLPFIYGIGTALPVMFFAVMIAFGVKSLSHWFKRISAAEVYMRKITGVIFIIAGVYYLQMYIMP